MTAQATVDLKAFGELVGFLMKRLQELEERVEELKAEVGDDIRELKGMIENLANDVGALNRRIDQNGGGDDGFGRRCNKGQEK